MSNPAAVEWLEKDYTEDLAPVPVGTYAGESLRVTRAYAYHWCSRVPGNISRPMFEIIPDHPAVRAYAGVACDCWGDA